jgi:hypothetical protein
MSTTPLSIPESVSSPVTPSTLSPFSSSPASSSSSISSGPSSPKEEHGRDPHELPEFSAKKIVDPGTPILYLPPLLSSLPSDHAPFEAKPSDEAPIPTTARLPTIDPGSLALHKALHSFRHVTADYAHIPYGDAFNWDRLVLPEEIEREWYCVAFRSVRKEGSDSDRELPSLVSFESLFNKL